MSAIDKAPRVPYINLDDLLEEDADLDFFDWGIDPMLILERKEQAEGYNCFGQPIQ